MATTIQWGGSQGGQSRSVEHPRELLHYGPPTPPRQPVASWATSLAAFQQYCTDGLYNDAINWLTTEYLYAVIADVPGGAQAGFKAYVQQTLRILPRVLQGPTGGWRTDGAAIDRDHDG